jgi:tetratricopeptide (TPR) repeat protein
MLRTLTGLVCLAVLNVALIYAQQLKEGEADPYNAVVKDLNSADFAKALPDLNAWKDKFPSSEYNNIRTALYVQTWAGLNQPEKALDTARELLHQDLKTLFPGVTGQAIVIRLLYNSTWAISRLIAPSPQQIASGENAARQLMAYDDALPGVSAEKWAEARTDMREKAAAALFYLAELPGIQAMARQPPDCPAAEAAWKNALAAYPDKPTPAYELARALNCQTKVSEALYEFQRAASLDPKIAAFADKAYVKFHGSDEGLDRLKAQVKESPLPPEGFTIRTADQIRDEANPQLALWKTIRDSLIAPDGANFFESQLKDAAVPALKGMLIEAKPACRPRELIIAIEGEKPEVLLKLEKPLTGRPELNTEITWEGAGVAFTANPFVLTMETSAVKTR